MQQVSTTSIPFITLRTQPQIIRDHLVSGKPITNLHALMVYGISRLAAVIEVLRRTDLEITTVMRHDEAGRKYAEYKLADTIVIGSMVTIKKGHGYGIPHWVKRTRPYKVVGLLDDVAYIEFKNGTKQQTIPMNIKELNYVA